VSVRIRKASSGDVSLIAQVHVRSWQAVYRGILADELLDDLKVTEREESWRALLSDSGERWLALVAEDSGGPIGFCSVATPSRDEEADEATAEIGALYVDPDHWREGAGRAMLLATLSELREKGYRDVVLWVLPENQPALAFYERFGFALEEGVEKREERSGRTVIRLRVALDEPIRLAPYDP
jgi:ribosomal protein S18 acetylase RimI-like enzyme